MNLSPMDQAMETMFEPKMSQELVDAAKDVVRELRNWQEAHRKVCNGGYCVPDYEDFCSLVERIEQLNDQLH